MTAVAPVATGEPVVLSGVAHTEADIAAHPAPVGPSGTDIVTPTRTQNGAIASTPLPGSTAPVVPAARSIPPVTATAPAPKPVIAVAPPATEPLPGLAPAPRPAPPPPAVMAAPAPVISAPSPPTMPTITSNGSVGGQALDSKGFPNLNVPPPQPSAPLLSAEEKARLIAELNALAGRPQ